MTKYKTAWLVGAALMLGGANAVRADTDRLFVNATRYEQEYPAIQYSGPARDNRIWRLQDRLHRGEIKLQWEPKWGYLRSLLQALEIDTSAQTLVFSKTSLQTSRIGVTTPRAIYYNDDTYVAYVQGSDLLELVAVDAKVGVVFFAMINRQDTSPLLDREGGRCLTCHDTYSMMGGGVPRVLVMSAPVDDPHDLRAYDSASEVDDRTPIAERWGGWYLSGWYTDSKGGPSANHFGNLPLRSDASASETDQLKALLRTRDNRANLVGYFDTTAYFTDKSDVVALLVLEHQTFVQNLITRVHFKAQMVMSRDDRDASKAPRSWAEVGPRSQLALQRMIEPLLRALFFADAAPLDGQVVSSSGFAERFAQVGLHDAEGRSLRALQLNKRLFRYPLSYMIYSESFNSLPVYAREYLDTRIVAVLQGRDQAGISDALDAGDRAAISQILAATVPRFATLLERRPSYPGK